MTEKRTQQSGDFGLQIAFDKGFEAVKAYIDKQHGKLIERIAALESRPTGLKYHGIWTEGRYDENSAVTHGGSVWIAKRATSAKPDSHDGDWQLAVRRGRDARGR